MTTDKSRYQTRVRGRAWANAVPAITRRPGGAAVSASDEGVLVVRAEHNGDGLWRFVAYRLGAVASKSQYRYESDLEALYAGKKAVRA